MKTICVYADFDWLTTPMLVGELGYESLRGSDSYAFKFDDNWLRQYGSLFLCADINNYPGQQYTQPGRDIFGCFSDALPDRWGRLLLNRREQIMATEEQQPVRKLSSFDYLMGMDDFSRMGGFRFKADPNGGFINCESYLRIPPLTSPPASSMREARSRCSRRQGTSKGNISPLSRKDSPASLSEPPKYQITLLISR